MTKVCTKCKQEKGLEDFARDSKKADKRRSNCKGCERLYRKANREKRLLQKKQWFLKNKDKVQVRRKKYYHANKDKFKKYMEQYRINNPEKINANKSKRRAAKLRATPEWADPKKIEHVYWVCNFLSKYIGIEHHVDHIHPLQSDMICGLHVHTNLQILTAEENRSKGNKFECP